MTEQDRNLATAVEETTSIHSHSFRSSHSHSARSLSIYSLSIWILALIMGIAIRSGWLPAIDIPLLMWLSAQQSNGLQTFMGLLTLSGHWLTFLIMLTILAAPLIHKKQFRSWLILVFSTLSTWILNFLLKISFRRQRPPLEFFRIEQSGLSYPSGHAMVSVAFYLLAALMLARSFPEKRWPSIVLGIFSFLPGLSRLFLGVHYPTDVIMGWLLGLSTAFFWYKLWLELEKEKQLLQIVKRSLHDF